MSELLPQNFSYSQSALHSFLRCERAFYLRYIQQARWPAELSAEALQAEKDRQAGVRFHRILHQYLLGLPLVSLRAIASADPDSRVKTWLEAFLLTDYAQLSGILRPEYEIAVEMERFSFTAKFDLFHEQDGRINLYDWKTSRIAPTLTQLESGIQSRLYLCLCALREERRQGLPPEALSFVVWDANAPREEKIIHYSNEKFQSDRSYFTGLVREIESRDEDHFNQTGRPKHCGSCQYRIKCLGPIAMQTLDFEDLFPAYEEFDDNDY